MQPRRNQDLETFVMKIRDKEKQAFDDIGNYIRLKIEKYRISTDGDGKALYQVYVGIYSAWQAAGLEAGFIHKIEELK